MITSPSTGSRSKTLKNSRGPLAFVRPLKVQAKVEPEDARPVFTDSEGNLLVDSSDNILRTSGT